MGAKDFKIVNGNMYVVWEIGPGDTVERVCLAYGITDWETVYRDFSNDPLRNKFPDPNKVTWNIGGDPNFPNLLIPLKNPTSAATTPIPPPPPTPCCFLKPILTDNYGRYIDATTSGKVTPLINGRSSGGSGPDIDLTEPLDEMQKCVAALESGDFVYLGSWFFEPATHLTAGPYKGATQWGPFFAEKAKEGVKVRLILNDFHPFDAYSRDWLKTTSLAQLDPIILGMPESLRKNFKYLVLMHPAQFGSFKSGKIRDMLKNMKADRAARGIDTTEIDFVLSSWTTDDIHVGSHHQKFMITNHKGETHAFCGGLDIESRKTPDRWSYHRDDDHPLVGWHDITVKLEGPITHDLEREFISRWNLGKGQSGYPALAGWDAMETLVASTPSDFDNRGDNKPHKVQMQRTVSDDAIFSSSSNLRDDIKQAYKKAIGCAKKFLYLENQYFRSQDLADWICARAKSQSSLIVIVVVVESSRMDDADTPVTAHGDYLQYTFFKKVFDNVGPRARFYTMKRRAVHSKMMLVDDHTLLVGSANANERSFVLDSELNVAVCDQTMVQDFRKRLWCHNLGLSTAEMNVCTDFIKAWDKVAASNSGKTGSEADMANMDGEGVVVYDYALNPGVKSDLVGDELANLDLDHNRIETGTPDPEGGEIRYAQNEETDDGDEDDSGEEDDSETKVAENSPDGEDSGDENADDGDSSDDDGDSKAAVAENNDSGDDDSNDDSEENGQLA